MLNLIRLVLLISYIKTGAGVSITEFEPTGLTKFTPSWETYFPGDSKRDIEAVYVNQTLVYCSSTFYNDTTAAYHVSVANLTDLTTTHRQVHAPFDLYDVKGTIFQLNGRVYKVVKQKRGSLHIMKGLLVLDSDGWRPLSGHFPYFLGDYKHKNCRTSFNSNNRESEVVYLMSECTNSVSQRIDFHRLEVIGNAVIMEHIAGFSEHNIYEVTFFTVWNGMLLAFVKTYRGGLYRYRIPISDEPLDIGQDTPLLVKEPFPGLVIARGHQIDNFVVFAAGMKYMENGNSDSQVFTNGTILDLNTMELTETGVDCGLSGYYVVDEIGKRLFQINTNDVAKVARLIT